MTKKKLLKKIKKLKAEVKRLKEYESFFYDEDSVSDGQG